MQTPEAFGAMPIKALGDEVVRLRDVAKVELAAESTDTIVSFNGSAGTFLGVYPTPAANPIDMAAAGAQELPSIQASLPEGMSLVLVYDDDRADQFFDQRGVHDHWRSRGHRHSGHHRLSRPRSARCSSRLSRSRSR
ncbi:efflux RND transporter permease subunit [Brucella abortus]|nr:efflux RND transporter permease subunit [Brucella abortus]